MHVPGRDEDGVTRTERLAIKLGFAGTGDDGAAAGGDDLDFVLIVRCLPVHSAGLVIAQRHGAMPHNGRRPRALRNRRRFGSCKINDPFHLAPSRVDLAGTILG